MKYRLTQSVLLYTVIAIFLSSTVKAAFLGDINQDGDVNLQDAILGLQIVTGTTPAIPTIETGIDVDQDGKIGQAEVLYTLQAVKNNSVALQHQAAIVGPLSGAAITAFRADQLGTGIGGTKKANTSSNDLLVAGTFDLNLPGVTDDEWVVVVATAGEDIDADGNGVADAVPTANMGTLHALAKAGDWRTKNIKISPLTEIVWRYTENLMQNIPATEVGIRLADLARNLIKTDLDGNGTIDWYDFLVFDPADPVHRNKLTTSYDWLITEDEDGHSILGSLLAGDEEQMLSNLDETYSYLLTRFPVPDSRYHSVKVTLSIFGPGSATSGAPHSLTVDSILAEPVFEDHIYLPENESTLVTFTATASQDTQILSWSGCETVSGNLSQCTVSLNKSQSVVVNFGRTTAQLAGTLHDLTNTQNVLTINTISVLIPDDMTDMIAEMAAAAVDDFVVGDDGGGFLRKITAINQISTTYYLLDTIEASLDEVIHQGTGQIYKQMTNGDLEGYTASSTVGTAAKIATTAFTPTIQGVDFVASNDPADTTFTLILGSDATSTMTAESFIEDSATVTLIDGLTATGQISFDITIDQAIDFSGGELKSFKFISILDAEQQVELTASKELAKFDFVRVKIGSFRFTPIVFAIGVVPAWVSPIVDVYFFAEGKVSAELSFGISFSQKVEGGVLYNRNTGWSIHKDFSSDHSFIPPTGKIKASIKGGIEARPVLKLYDATGPAIPQQIYAKMSASASTEIFGTCSDIVLKNSYGFESAFLWDLSGTTKFGKLLHLDQFEEMTRFNIVDFERTISTAVLYDNCPEYVAGSHLVVEGDSIFSTIAVGDVNGLVTSLTVENTGDETLHWNTSFVPPDVAVAPSFGVLAPGEHSTVQMSLFTAGLPAGRYLHKILFFNEGSVGSDLPDEQFGNSWKTVDVNVQGLITDVPVIMSAVSSNVGRVTFDWDFSASGTVPFVGFQIFMTETPEDLQSYQHIYTSPDIFTRTATISGLTPGSTYSFDIRAYSNNGAEPGPFSNKVSVTVGGNPPPPFGVVYSAGQLWADRNLGASRVATSSTDSEAYGGLYQWGRLADGHESRTSPQTATKSPTDSPGHGYYIIDNATTSLKDWRNPSNNTLWQGVSGINNPCPAGFRLPTITELDTERLSWSFNNLVGAFASPLKLVVGGDRSPQYGALSGVGSGGCYWASTAAPIGSYQSSSHMCFHSTYGFTGGTYRAAGNSVRCIKD